MGIDISFLYEAEDKGRFSAPEAIGVYLIDLFEVPDALAQEGIFDSLERVEELGFLPSFVKRYREEMGSSLGELYATTPEQRQKEFEDFTKKMFAHIDAGGAPAEFFDTDGSCEIIASADEVEAWADRWLGILNGKALTNPELLQFYLPYSHEVVAQVLLDLQEVKAQAQEAKLYGVDLRLEACIG